MLFKHYTVKFLNFQTPEILTVIYLTFKVKGQIANLRGFFYQKDSNGIANSEARGADRSVSALFAKACMSEN